MNKKIAICFHGLSTGMNDKNQRVSDINESYESIKKYITNGMETDVFFHTWINDNIDKKNYLLDLYKPKKFIFEKKKDFHSERYKQVTSYQSAKSRWLSHKNVIELVNEYSMENNIKYDIIFITRFDCLFLNDFKLNKLKITNHLYISNWEKDYDKNYFNKCGVCDLWWFGNLEVINKFKDIFDNIDNYLKYIDVSNHLLSYYHIKINNIPIKYYKYILKDFDITRRLLKLDK